MTDDHRHHHPTPPGDLEARALALESLLIEKSLTTSDAIERLIAVFEHDIGPMRGAHVVARAWTDEAFERRLLSDGKKALAELGIVEHLQIEKLVVVKNSPAVHNVIVCTLCSCYPWMVLGLPPSWYKSSSYRSRVVQEPRTVLAEMGLQLAPEKAVRVWDSSAEVRYMVLPERPPATEGWSEEKLAAIITRDSMVGVATVAVPAE